MFVVINHTINLRQIRTLNQTANKAQIFWMRMLYWKSRHVDFLTIAVDRGGGLEMVSGISVSINIFRCSHVLNFRFVNGKPPYRTGGPIFCIISISISIDSHSSWRIEWMSVVSHLAARRSRPHSCCTLTTWSWVMMTISCLRSPLYFAIYTSLALVSPSIEESRPATWLALMMPCDNMILNHLDLLSGVAVVLLIYKPLRLNYCTCFGVNKN